MSDDLPPRGAAQQLFKCLLHPTPPNIVANHAENTAGEIPMRVIPLELARNVHPSQASELLADRGRVTSRHRAPATGRVGELNCLDRRNPQRVHEFGAHGGAVRDFGGRNANAETFSGDGERRTVAVEHAAAGRDHHLVTAVL